MLQEKEKWFSNCDYTLINIDLSWIRNHLSFQSDRKRNCLGIGTKDFVLYHNTFKVKLTSVWIPLPSESKFAREGNKEAYTFYVRESRRGRTLFKCVREGGYTFHIKMFLRQWGMGVQFLLYIRDGGGRHCYNKIISNQKKASKFCKQPNL